MDLYEHILTQIQKDISGDATDVIQASDESLINASAKEDSECEPQYDRRNVLYSDLLEYYIKSYKLKTKCNAWYKGIFFGISNVVFLIIVISSVVVLINVSKKPEVAPADIATVLGSVAGIVSSIIVLPKIIAEHLFPTNENEHMIDMVKNMQVNDSKIRSFYKGKHPQNKHSDNNTESISHEQNHSSEK